MSNPTDGKDDGAGGAADRLGSASAGARDGEDDSASPRKAPLSDSASPRLAPQQASLGILFIAAALGLALLLTIIGLLAYLAMSRSPAPLPRGATTWFDAPWPISVLS